MHFIFQGDKGGCSTKLAAQLVNVNKPNSATTTEILAMFEAVDSYENMTTAFDIYNQQFTDLQRSAEIEVDGKKRSCRLFLFGDYEFLTRVMGHLGPVSVYPCIWCYVPLAHLHNTGGLPHTPKIYNHESGKWVDNVNWPSKRTPHQMQQDLADNIADQRNRGDTKKNSRYYNSIHRRQIFPITTDNDHIIPPILHIMLGLTVRYFKDVEVICRKYDRTEVIEGDQEVYEEWEEKTREVYRKEEDMEGLKDEAEYMNSVLDGFVKCKNNVDVNKGLSEKCSMPTCALINHKVKGTDASDIKWVECVSCRDGTDEGVAWFHVDCAGLRNEDVEREGFKYKCMRCEGKMQSQDDVLKWQKGRIKDVKKAVQEKGKEVQKAKKALQAVYKKVEKIMGPKERELNRILEEELKVKKQAYHSQCYVGNHCHIILKKANEMLRVIDGLEEHGRYIELFSRLHNIFQYTEARFLSEHEIKSLCALCWDLGIWFPQNFPEQSIPPKLHILIGHVPECAMRWHTLGLLAEHGLESLHAQVNADNRIYNVVRDQERRMILRFKSHGLRAIVNTSGLHRQTRKCDKTPNCDGYLSTVNGERLCQTCSK